MRFDRTNSSRVTVRFAGALGLACALAASACARGETPHALTPAAPTASTTMGPDAGVGPAEATPSGSAVSGPTAALPVPPAPNPVSTKVTAKNDATWATCHRGYEAKKKDVVKDVQAMAIGCAKVTNMNIVGKTLTGKQSDQDPPQTFPLSAEAGHCYRVYSQASDGIRDLDLAIKDSTGAVAGEDSTDDASPVLLEDGAVCFKEADSATIIVSVGLGKGTYALEIWRD